MTRLLILVEGQTEEVFVRDTLAPHLASFGVYVERPSLVWTKRLPHGGEHRGGVSNWAMIHKDLLRLLNDTDANVTTMLDLYGLPADFHGEDVLSRLGAKDVHVDGYSVVEELEKRFAVEIGNERFIPFLTLFEFEALVFSSPMEIANHFESPKLESAIQNIVDAAKSPELINGSESTHPKKRLMHLFEKQNHSYKPANDGPTILQKIGIQTIRDACPHFNAWITRLESLGVARQ